MSTTATFEDTFTNGGTLSLWNGSNGLWQPAYDWSPDGYMDSSMSSWLVNPAYGPTSAADADVYQLSSSGLDMEIKPLPSNVSSSSVGGAQFLSGQLTTEPTFSQEYGYFQVTAELPTATSGISSAFWLLPESGAWPPEVDIFESDGSQGPSAFENGVFTGSSSDPVQTYQWEYNLPNLTTSYNTFALDWTASTMTWYFDGKQVYQIATPSQMNQAMYMLLDDVTDNGGWNGAAPAGYSGNMSIQSVYVFDNMTDADAAGVVPGVAGSGASSSSSGTSGSVSSTGSGDPSGSSSTSSSSSGSSASGSGSGSGTGTTTTDSGTIVLSSSNLNPDITQSNVSITGTGTYVLFIGGTGDTAILTGSNENVQADNGYNSITINGSGGNTIEYAGTNNTINAGSGSSMLYDNGTDNTIVMPEAGQGFDNVFGEVFQNGDTIDLTQLLGATEWNGEKSTLSSYLKITTTDNNATLYARDTTSDSWSNVATFQDLGRIGLRTLLAHSIA